MTLTIEFTSLHWLPAISHRNQSALVREVGVGVGLKHDGDESEGGSWRL